MVWSSFYFLWSFVCCIKKYVRILVVSGIELFSLPPVKTLIKLTQLTTIFLSTTHSCECGRKTNSSKNIYFLTNHQNKIAPVFWPPPQNTFVIKSSALPSNCYHANKMNPSVVKRSVTAHQSFFQCITLSLYLFTPSPCSPFSGRISKQHCLPR